MMLHTGESVLKARKDLKLQDRQKLGEFFLRNLAAALIAGLPRLLSGSVRNQDWMRGVVSVVQADLELDGYLYKDGQLLQVEADVLDVQEESGVLQSLFQELHLNERETTFHHLTLSEEHYVSRRWDDCIGNARKFLELVLSEVSSKHCLSKNGKPLATKAYESPREVRDYLEQEGLLETREKEALAKIYGLLSHTGGHPYMAANEQARLLRHMALTFAQFVMLRLQGALAASAGKGLQPAEPQEGNVQ